MPGVLCAYCGQLNPDDARYCARCGSALTQPGARSSMTGEMLATLPYSWRTEPEDGGTSVIAQLAAAMAALPTGAALLVVTRGPNAGSRFLLEMDVTTAGRHPSSDVFLDDVTVSRRHAEFHRREGAFLIRDVDSLNGTYVNKERVEEVTLARGDELQIGRFRLVFLVA